MNIESISKLSKLMEIYGVAFVVLAFFMVIFLGIIIWLIKTNSKFINKTTLNNNEIIDKLTNIQNKHQSSLKSFTKETTKAIENLSKSMSNIFKAQNEEFDDIYNEINLLKEEIDKRKKWDLNSYKRQIKSILKLSIIDIKDYVLNKIEINSLIKNYDMIINEIETKTNRITDNGRDNIKDIPFSSSFDEKLFKKTEKIKKESLSEVKKILDVKKDYNKTNIKRRIRLLTDKTLNKTEKAIDKTIEEERAGD